MPIRLTSLLLYPVMAGCSLDARPDFDAADPGLRVAAMHDAVDRGDRSSIPALVEALDSDDAGVRFAAIDALQRLTGETLGYRYDAAERDRWAAAERWRSWIVESAAEAGA